MRRYVKRWGVGLLATLALLGMGLLYTSPTLLTAALIPLAYLLYGSLSRAPSAPELSVSRTVATSNPEPGEPVSVTLRVENDGDAVLPDLRVIDGVPAEIAVTEGTARLSCPLSPGEAATATYTAIAKRGEFVFDDPAVRLRSLSGSEQVTETVTATGDRGFTCTNTVTDAPLLDSTIMRQGSLPVDDGGPGQEFYATRQYKQGDPMNRIDWRHVAKTGEFITIQYRKERAAKTVLVVDARPVNRVTPAAGYPTGAQLAGYAAELLFDSLSTAGVTTTVAALGFDPDGLGGLVGPDGIAWIDPREDTGRQSRAGLLFHRLQADGQQEVGPLSFSLPDEWFASLSDTDPTGAVTTGGATDTRTSTVTQSPRDEETGQWSGSVGARADGGAGREPRDDEPVETGRADERIHRLLTRLPADAQVVLCSPLLDNWPVSLAHALSVRGHSVVTVSPDAVSAATPGQRLAAVSRRARLRTIERVGGRTVDWNVGSPLDRAVRLSLPHLLSEQ